MKWHDYSRIVPKGSHAPFSPSSYHWINYSEAKAIEYIRSMKAKEIGTELHAIAALNIKHGIMLAGEDTLAMYVNDAIKLNMDTEILLYFSPFFYGYADAICIDHENVLRNHDLKTGIKPASMNQLYIYNALYCLDYSVDPNSLGGIEDRIYQNNEVFIDRPDPQKIIDIMMKIKSFNAILTELNERGEL